MHVFGTLPNSSASRNQSNNYIAPASSTHWKVTAVRQPPISIISTFLNPVDILSLLALCILRTQNQADHGGRSSVPPFGFYRSKCLPIMLVIRESKMASLSIIYSSWHFCGELAHNMKTPAACFLSRHASKRPSPIAQATHLSSRREFLTLFSCQAGSGR